MKTQMRNIEELNSYGGEIYLDLGAGGASKKDGYFSVDLAQNDGVDFIEDVGQALSKIDGGRVDGIYSRHFLEHIEDVTTIITEMVRVCKNGAKIDIIVPHFSNPFFYSDVTHRRFFGLYSFSYMAKTEEKFVRSIPTYAQIDGLRQKSVRLHFQSYRPRYGRFAMKKIFQFIFNSSIYMRELYEENFCWLIPCYEIRYELYVDKSE